MLNFEAASFNNFLDIPKSHFVTAQRWRRTSTVALSKNAFAFRLKTKNYLNKIQLTDDTRRNALNTVKSRIYI